MLQYNKAFVLYSLLLSFHTKQHFKFKDLFSVLFCMGLLEALYLDTCCHERMQAPSTRHDHITSKWSRFLAPRCTFPSFIAFLQLGITSAASVCLQ